MKQDKLNNLCKKILEMSREIVDKLGHPLIKEGYYNDKHYANEYVYEKLKINENLNGNLQIYIGNEEVFYYVAKEKRYGYKYGQWTELIETIYDQVPNIARERELELLNIRKKKDSLLELEKYFKCYIEFNDVSNIVDINLNKYNISIIKDERHDYMTNLVQGYDMEYTYYIYVVRYNGKKVAEFNDNVLDIFPNVEYYVDKFVLGEWIDKFKKVISDARITNERLIQDEVNKSASDMIKSFRRA